MKRLASSASRARPESCIVHGRRMVGIDPVRIEQTSPINGPGMDPIEFLEGSGRPLSALGGGVLRRVRSVIGRASPPSRCRGSRCRRGRGRSPICAEIDSTGTASSNRQCLLSSERIRYPLMLSSTKTRIRSMRPFNVPNARRGCRAWPTTLVSSVFALVAKRVSLS